MIRTLKILLLAAEAEPFVKVGGLADVAGSLPLALRDLSPGAGAGSELDVRLVLPLHGVIHALSESMSLAAEFPVFRKGAAIQTQVFELSLSGMPVYFIGGTPLTSARSVYSTDQALDREKYTFFCLAILEFIRRLDWQPDILHANDWHTSLALYALRSVPAAPGTCPIRSVLTVHNLVYMGGDGSDVLTAFDLPSCTDEALPDWARSQPLPLGLRSADVIVPVSPSYAGEILTPEYGCGLENYLNGRQEAVTGILNGLDTGSWNPAADVHLAARFSAADLAGRGVNKAALQDQFGLVKDPQIALIAMIGRIDPQKGVDLALEALQELEPQAWQFILLGSGDPALEQIARETQVKYPDRMRVVLRYDAALSRLLYGGADIFLMPSRYEPCGLAQMIAMHYGCLPVVHATGGLKDTVQAGRTGFLFERAEVPELVQALGHALAVHSRSASWQRYQRSAMLADFSWSASARQYAGIYRSLASP